MKQPRKNPPRYWALAYRSGEWRVMHGNKIVARFSDERMAEAEFRRRRGF